MRVISLVVFLIFSICNGAYGFDRIGTAFAFSNDTMGDGQDRWRTASLQFSTLHSVSNSSASALELRFRAEIIAPQSVIDPRLMYDRPYAGVLGAGAFWHTHLGKADLSIGAEVTVVGEQTGLASLQNWVHSELGYDTYPFRMPNQVDDDTWLGFEAEVSRDLAMKVLRKDTTVRPFLTVQTGMEDIVRAGFDMIVGAPSLASYKLRDKVTGQLLFPEKPRNATGLSLTIGGDISYVGSSAILPTSRRLEALRYRHRMRVGLRYDRDRINLFYGLAVLGPEFKDQTSSQTVGTVDFSFKF